jgi:hypothetical protein
MVYAFQSLISGDWYDALSLKSPQEIAEKNTTVICEQYLKIRKTDQNVTNTYLTIG